MKSYYEYLIEMSDVRKLHISQIPMFRSLKDFKTQYMKKVESAVMDPFEFEIQNYREQYDINDDIDDESILEDNNFIQIIYNDIKIKADNLIEDFYWLPDGDNLMIWRMMTVNQDFINSLTDKTPLKVGIYWSWKESAADAHWGESHDYRILIEGIINQNDVDWVEMLPINLDPSTGEEEKEIKLNDNTKINVVKITNEKTGNILPFNKNKIFYA